MKKKMLAALMLGGSLAAHAAMHTASFLKAEVPFDFQVGGRRLPVGKYLVRQVTTTVLEIRGLDSKAGASIAYIAESRDEGSGKGAMTFRCYGDQCFFAGAADGFGSGMTALRTRAEKEVAKGAVTRQVVPWTSGL